MGSVSVRKVPNLLRNQPRVPRSSYPTRIERIPPLPCPQATPSLSAGVRTDTAWLLICFVLAAVWCQTAAHQLGATFDEPFYIRCGLEHWRTGQCRGLTSQGTMPLPVDVATFPLYLVECWRGIPIDPVKDLAEWLPLARAGNLVFLGLLLFYAWKAGRSLAGPWGGRLAVAFLACEPTVLAHAGLATTDIAVTACLLALVYHYRTAREPDPKAGRFRRLVLPTFWFAATVLSKASGIVFGPLCLLAMELELFARYGNRRRLRWACVELTLIAGIGLILACLYCGSSDGTRRARLLSLVDRVPSDAVRGFLLPLAKQVPLVNNALDGIWFQVRHNVDGHYGSFLLGQWHSNQRIWYYFPVALAIKLTLSLLGMALLLAVVRPRSLRSWPWIAAGVLLAFSLTCRVQIGVRYMLPLVVLAGVGLGAGCAAACRRFPLFRFAVPLALLWSLTSAIAVWPHGLCYANEMWGGTEKGYLHLSDSNYDWGQGIKELYRWQKDHNIARLDIWYFGSDPLRLRLPMRWLHYENMRVHEPGGMLDLLRGRYLAVSTSVLYGHPYSESEAAAFLRARVPVDRTSTFLIYYFPAE